MEQHPIPQQIASYQFKLVGDMTLKQFTQLAGGALISLLLYSTPLHPFIKWPLVVLSFLFGVALAFLPFQDRPLSTWLLLFFRSVYSPTYFVWNKAIKAPEYFAPEETGVKPASLKIAEKKEEVQELVKPVIKETEATTNLEEKEKSFLTRVSQNFIAPNTTVVISTTPIHTYSQKPLQGSSTAKPMMSSFNVQTGQVKQQAPTVNIPQQTTVGTDTLSGYQTKGVVSSQNQQVPPSATSGISPYSYQKMDVQKMAASQFSKDVMPPLPSTQENVVVGQILDRFGQIVEGAILEIKNPDGRPVRALKSNKLGHFMIATPLIAGDYIIQTEKDGFEFEPVTLKVEDKIIPPIAIWATDGGEKKGDVLPQRSIEEKSFLKDFDL
jgi:hypothetical protein